MSEEDKTMFFDGFEDAFMGSLRRFGESIPVAVYDYSKCMKIMMEKHGMEEDEAVEWIEFNCLGGWVGEGTPCMMFRCTLNEMKEEFTFILFSDDYSLDSFNRSVEYLKSLKVNYEFGHLNDFLLDFKILSYCDYIISTPSTFCITASLCGLKSKKIIHNKEWVLDYKLKSDYFRDIFWKNLLESQKTNDYVLYKLI